MLHRQLDGRLGRVDSAGRQVLAKLTAAAEQIADDYEHLRYSSAMRTTNALADEVNRYFDAARPWITVKTDQQATRAVLTTTLNASRILATYLKPVVPRFAAVVPICGGGDPTSAERLKDLPIWVFHGADDTTVPPDRSRHMVRAIKDAGGTKIKFTEYPGVGHGSWKLAYADPEFLKWMFKQKKSR